MKKIILILSIISLTACNTVSEKTSKLKPNLSKLKPNIGTCPEKSERTLKDILCREPK